VYQGEQDQIVPYKVVDEAVSSYCSLRANIQYYKDPSADHRQLIADGEPFALSWLTDRLNGQPASSGCTTYTTDFPANRNTALPTTNATVTVESIPSAAAATSIASSATAINGSTTSTGSSTAVSTKGSRLWGN
jgi:hypothetical protein